MDNSKNYILNLIKTLSPDEKIEINSNGEIKVIHHDNYGKKHTKNAGSLFENLETIIPLPNKPWVNIQTVGFTEYRDFGKKPKVNIIHNYDSEVMAGVFETLLLMNTPILGNFVDNNRIHYITKKIGEYTGFYAYDKLQYILFRNKQYLIPRTPDKLTTKKFKNIEEVK